MTKRIFTGIILVALISMLVGTGLVMGVVYDYLGEKIDNELHDEALMVQTALKLEGENYLDVLKAAETLDSRITLISYNGEVLFDSEVSPSSMENHMGREEIEEAVLQGEGYAVRHSATISKDTRYYALKMDDGNILRVASEHYSQLALILDTFGVVIIIIAIMMGLGIIISARITRGIIKPVNDIDLDAPVIPDGYDELAPLLQRINQQNKKIQGQMSNLKKQQNEFNIITQNMSEGLLMIDKDKEILTYNKSALSLLDAEDCNQSGSVLQLNRSEAFRNSVEKALDGKHHREMLVVGESICEIIANPVLDKGKVTGAVLLIIDVTEKEKGEHLRREFTSNVSHELKTPPTSIYGVSDMLTTGLVKQEDVAGFAGTIKEESARLISLIEDIIKLSQLDEESIPHEKHPVDVYGVAQDVIRRLDAKAKRENVKVTLSGSSVSIKGIESVVDEILYNLCENAIKYNKPEGTVDVQVNRIGDECIIKIEDTGIGIPKADLSRVFERFYRVDKSHSKATGGTGLGLSIVKHAVSYLDGTISIESTENIGTRIILKFFTI